MSKTRTFRDLIWPRRREGADNRPIFEYRWTIEGLRPYPYLRQKVLILKNPWALPSYRTKDKMYAVIYIIGVAIEEIRVTVTALVSRLEIRTKFIKLIKSIVHATPCLWLGQTRTKLYNLFRKDSSYSPLPSPSQCFFFCCFFFFSLLPGFFIVIINDFLTTVATK